MIQRVRCHLAGFKKMSVFVGCEVIYIEIGPGEHDFVCWIAHYGLEYDEHSEIVEIEYGGIRIFYLLLVEVGEELEGFDCIVFVFIVYGVFNLFKQYTCDDFVRRLFRMCPVVAMGLIYTDVPIEMKVVHEKGMFKEITADSLDRKS